MRVRDMHDVDPQEPDVLACPACSKPGHRAGLRFHTDRIIGFHRSPMAPFAVPSFPVLPQDVIGMTLPAPYNLHRLLPAHYCLRALIFVALS